MTLETTPVDSDASEESAHNDLTQIKGSGPVRQEILQDNLGIKTFEDLASASVEAIEAMLRRENQAVSQQEVVGWIEQAQARIEVKPVTPELAASESEVPESVTSESVTSETTAPESVASEAVSGSVVSESVTSESVTSKTTVPNDLEHPIDEFSETEETEITNTSLSEEWNSIGSFTVEFQSRTVQAQTEYQITVRHLETNRTRQWSSFEDIAWRQWMLTQIKSPALQGNASACLPGENPMAAQIKSVKLFQPPESAGSVGTELTQSNMPITIRSGESFELEVIFELTGSTQMVTVQRPDNCLIQCFTKGLTAPHRLMLLSEIQSHPLTHDHTLYKTTLPAATLTSGLYRLQILITFHGAFALSAFVEIPLLQVV